MCRKHPTLEPRDAFVVYLANFTQLHGRLSTKTNSSVTYVISSSCCVGDFGVGCSPAMLASHKECIYVSGVRWFCSNLSGPSGSIR